MTTWKLTIAYDGSPFAGWAIQPGLRTVQGEIEDAIEQITGERARLTVAGRTDAGVHATGQVASVELANEPPDRLAVRLNAVLPRQIAIRAAESAPDGFDARRWARSRSYRYRVLAAPERDPFEEGKVLWWPHRVDRAALDESAAAVIGEHDFTAFTPTQTEHVRFERLVSDSRWIADPARHELLVYEITADAFMRTMIRVLVGTMLEVAGGRREVADFAALLDGAPRERAGETVPPHGLFFSGVVFGDGPTFSHT